MIIELDDRWLDESMSGTNSSVVQRCRITLQLPQGEINSCSRGIISCSGSGTTTSGHNSVTSDEICDVNVSRLGL